MARPMRDSAPRFGSAARQPLAVAAWPVAGIRSPRRRPKSAGAQTRRDVTGNALRKKPPEGGFNLKVCPTGSWAHVYLSLPTLQPTTQQTEGTG